MYTHTHDERARLIMFLALLLLCAVEIFRSFTLSAFAYYNEYDSLAFSCECPFAGTCDRTRHFIEKHLEQPYIPLDIYLHMYL